MRVLVDTNVFIDYVARRHPFYKAWGQLNAMQVVGDVEIWTTPQSFSDAFYILSKEYSSEQLQRKFLGCLKFMNVCSTSLEDIELACNRCWSDYEDCLVAICAEKVKADYLLTRDKTGFVNSAIPTYSLEEFFTMLESEYGLFYDEINL